MPNVHNILKKELDCAARSVAQDQLDMWNEIDRLRSLTKELESKLYTCIEALEWARGLINESDLTHTNAAVFVREALAKAKERG